MQRKEQGFTLIELIVTIAVLAIIASIAAPSMNDFRKDQQIKEQEKKIKLALTEARTEARLQNKSMTVSFAPLNEGASNIISVDIDSAKYEVNKTNEIVFRNNGMVVIPDKKKKFCLQISEKNGIRTKYLELSVLGVVSASKSDCNESDGDSDE